jgi:hypothetical protein
MQVSTRFVLWLLLFNSWWFLLTVSAVGSVTGLRDDALRLLGRMLDRCVRCHAACAGLLAEPENDKTRLYETVMSTLEEPNVRLGRKSVREENHSFETVIRTERVLKIRKWITCH